MNYLKISFLVGAILIAYFYGCYEGYSGEREKFNAYKKEMSALTDEKIRHNAILVQQQNFVTKGLEDVYKSELNSVHFYYDGLLKDVSASRVPAVSETSRKLDADAAYYRLAKRCAQTTAQIISLQKWVKDQYELNHGRAT